MSASTKEFAAAQRIAHVQPLGTLKEKVLPEHTALVVIDVQNDFCAPGGMMDQEGLDLTMVREVADRLPALLSAARAAGVLVIFVKNVYSTENNFYLSDSWLAQASRVRQGSYTTRPVCAEGTWEGAFYGAVRPEPGEPIVRKHRFSPGLPPMCASKRPPARAACATIMSSSLPMAPRPIHRRTMTRHCATSTGISARSCLSATSGRSGWPTSSPSGIICLALRRKVWGGTSLPRCRP